MIKSLFISKELSEAAQLEKFCKQHSIELSAHSLISFEPVHFTYSCDVNCVFFSSPRSASYFLKSVKLDSSQLIGAAGEATKTQIEAFGYKVDFVPFNSGLTEQSSQEFAEWLADKTVLFPISTISNKSYASKLKDEQVSFVIVYETQLNPKKIPTCDGYVFTSPSNVEAYLKMNSIAKDKLVIAYGESTNARLIEAGILNARILKTSSVDAVIDLLGKQVS